MQAGLGAAPAFRVPEYELRSLYELPLFLLFGILCGAVSAVFTYGTKVCAVTTCRSLFMQDSRF